MSYFWVITKVHHLRLIKQTVILEFEGSTIHRRNIVGYMEFEGPGEETGHKVVQLNHAYVSPKV